ncbi:hypothetical protein CDV55_105701 [Aspergillus turcosus]|uniref:Uncharacterized protein n=1 Tax=Aspergillus turcosus TaxID=1245748 RepID=A0A229WVL6_9EURO|nr:hypothetical protein CDV55_105701 [Aspergillus turcosus]RLL93679.1 hypothetical protein CFD26_103054 [Aspergillus turcosus]
MDEDSFMELRKGAITEAKKTALRGRLTITDLSIVKLLDVLRKADWTHNTENHPIIRFRPLETTAHSSALLLQERGIKPQSACDLCLKTKNKPFQSCICAPAFRRHALRLGACANCIWHGREAHCSLRTEFVAAGGKKWVFTLDLIVLHGGGLLYTEGIGRRLRGLPPLQSPRTPAITARKAHPLTESKVESRSRRGDKSSLPTRRLAGNSNSTSVLGKRSAASSVEPQAKRTCHKDRDGKLVPWPCTTASWNDPDALKIIYSDLERHVRAVKRRIEELEAGSLEIR